MQEVFLLWHTYDLKDDFGIHEEIKLIGVFSTEEKANEVIELLKNREGFVEHSVDCFEISKRKIDQPSWTEGFFTVRYMDES